MSYYNPKIYNKENLHEDDLKDLEYWHHEFMNLIENEKTDYPVSGGSDTLDKIIREIINDFCNRQLDALNYMMQENLVSIMDGYAEDEDVFEQEEWHTFIENYDD